MTQIQDTLLRGSSWAGAGIATNPTLNQIMADTGALGRYNNSEGAFLIIISASAAADISIEHRDSTNASNIEAVSHVMPASLVAFVIRAKLATNERIRVIMAAGLTGRLSASIHQVKEYD